MSNVLFIPCYYDGLPRASGSARIRAEWVCRYWDGAEVYDGSQRFAGYDLYVFQKAYLVEQTRYWIKTVARWRDGGHCRLAFDLCDPDFLEPEHERRMLSVLPQFDFAVATTQPIADWLAQWLPVRVIPDRVDLEEVRGIGRHTVTRSFIPQLVWAGYERNAGALTEIGPAVEGMGLSLEIMALHHPLSFDEFWRRVIEYDVLLNPLPDVPPFNYKSDNKTIIAQALGMPVARTMEDVLRLCDPRERRRESNRRVLEVEALWDVRLSVAEWQNVLREEGES